MKGLFIKDFSYIKESKLLFLFLVLFGFGASYFYKKPTFVLGYFSVFPSIILMSTISYDSINHGFTSLFTMPIKKENYLKQKYSLGILLGLLFLFFAICISSIGYYRIQHSFNFINSDFLQGCFLTLMFSYFVIAIVTPAEIYFEAQRSQLAMIIVFGGIFVCVALIYFLTKLIGFDLESVIDALIENHLSIVTLSTGLFTLICNIISYHISLKLLNKKEY